jgi:hypothetical protein
VQAVRTDHHPGALGDGPAVVPAVATDPDDRCVLDDEFVDREALPDLRSRLGRRIDQDLVQDRPTRGVRDGRLRGPRGPESVKAPKSNAYVSIGGHPVARTRSRRSLRRER